MVHVTASLLDFIVACQGVMSISYKVGSAVSKYIGNILENQLLVDVYGRYVTAAICREVLWYEVIRPFNRDIHAKACINP